MTNDAFAFDFDDDFAGSSVGTPEDQKWSYPPIGYDSTTGTLYIDSAETTEIELIPIAIRQCKEVTDRNGITYRYPVYAKKETMVSGPDKPVTRLQVLCYHDGALHVFGGKSWTMRAAWLNPDETKSYHDSNFPVGIWTQLLAHIKKVKAEKGLNTSPLCYRLVVQIGDKFTMPSKADPKKKTAVTRLRIVPAGATPPELVAELEALYETEDIAGWVHEWNVNAVSEEPANGSIKRPDVVDENDASDFDGAF